MLNMWSLVVVAFLFAKLSQQISDKNLQIVVTIMKELSPLANFNLVCKTSVKQAHYVLNQPFNNRRTFGLDQLTSSQHQSIIYCADEYTICHFKNQFLRRDINTALDTLVIVGSTSQLTKISYEITFEVKQRVYLFDIEQNILFESYRIKTESVKKVIANYDTNKKCLTWQAEKDFVSRRANYQSTLLTAALFYNPPYTSLNQGSRLEIERVSKNNETAVLIDASRAEGFNTDILNMLKKDLNFTLKVYWQIREGLGRPTRSNGMIKWTGSTGLLLSGKVDIIVSPTPKTLHQFSIKSFLHALGELKTALYVNINAGSNEKDWLTFTMPFRPHLWTLYVANSIFIAIGLNLIFVITGTVTSNSGTSCRHRSILAFIGDLWMVLMSYFSRPANSNFWWIISFSKVWLLFVFLSGNLTWMLYRASINAELSVRKHHLPFTSPKGLYESDFRVIHTWKNLQTSVTMFSNEVTCWVFKRLSEQEPEESYKRTMEEAVNELIQPYSDKAFFTTQDRMLLLPQHRCEVSEAWSNLQPYIFSLTLHKQSPYTETLNHALLKRMETSVFAQIKGRYFGRSNFKSACQREITKRPIVMEKVFGANVVFGLGVSLAVFLFLVEILTARLFNSKINGSVNCQTQQDYDSAFFVFAQKWSPTLDGQSKHALMQFDAELSDLVDLFM